MVSVDAGPNACGGRRRHAQRWRSSVTTSDAVGASPIRLWLPRSSKPDALRQPFQLQPLQREPFPERWLSCRRASLHGAVWMLQQVIRLAGGNAGVNLLVVTNLYPPQELGGLRALRWLISVWGPPVCGPAASRVLSSDCAPSRDKQQMHRPERGSG